MPPHQPRQPGSSEMTLTINQPCLEFTELGLTTMAAASARSKFCCQQKHVSQVPTWEKGDAPEGVESTWSAGAAWTLPIPSSLLSPGVWTHPTHRPLSHIRRGLLEVEIHPGNSHPHTQGKDSELPRWDGRGDLAQDGAPVLPFCSFGQRARGLSGGS